MAEKQTLARPYAKAAFQYALDNDALSGWSGALSALANVVQSDAFVAFASHPRVSEDKIFDVLVGIVGKERLSVAIENFLHILLQANRLLLMPEIATLFTEFVSSRKKVIKVNVTSAYPLNDTIRSQVQSKMAERLQMDVTLNCDVDKALLGGIVIRAGDMLIDGSVKSQLHKLYNNIVA